MLTCHSGSNCSSLVIFSRSLAEACSDGDVNAVRKLLDEGRSVNEHTEEGESLLCLACSAGYYELAQVCERKGGVGCDLHVCSVYCLCTAEQRWDHDGITNSLLWEDFPLVTSLHAHFKTLSFHLSSSGFVGHACQCGGPGYQGGHNATHGCCQRRLCGHCQTASGPWGRC